MVQHGFALKVLVPGFLCATSVSSVSLWCVFARNSSTTETQRTKRLHKEERDRDFLCKAVQHNDLSCRLKQLDRISVGIVQLDLLSTGTHFHFISKVQPGFL